MDTTTTLLLLLAGVLLVSGVWMAKLAARIGVPALVLFLGIGMVLGSDISGFVYFDDAWLSQFVGTMALILILLDGGLQTSWHHLRPVMRPALSLATLGVLITVGVIGLVAHYLLGAPWPFALLIGAIVGSTDASAVFAVIGEQNIPDRLKALLEAESGLNDPMAVFLTLLMLNWAKLGQLDLMSAVGSLLWEAALGIIIGLGAGYLLVKLMRMIRLGSAGLYPILMVGAAILTFALTGWLHGSGFLAVYMLAVTLGGAELPLKSSLISFHQGLGWLAQMVMFILLGLLVFPRQMLPQIWPGLLIAVTLLLVARPIAVWLSTLGMNFRWQERLLVAWSGLRGAVPIILATYPMLAGLPESHAIFHLVFFVVLTSAVLQGTTIPALAGRLGLVSGHSTTRPVRLELLSIGRVGVELLELELLPGSCPVGLPLAKVPLPEGATVSALLRGERLLAPRGATRLEAGDVLFMLVQREQVEAVRAVLA